MKIKVILGSIREGRAGEKVAKWFMEAVKDSEADLELVDLKEYNLPLLTDAVSAMARGDEKNENPLVQKWLDKITEADGFIFITPEYNHGIPGAFKNAIDFGFKEWHDKAVGFIGYGGSGGGSRAIEQWRQVVAELQMFDVRTQVLIPLIWEAFDEQGNLKNADSHARGAQKVLQEVVELTKKLHS